MNFDWTLALQVASAIVGIGVFIWTAIHWYAKKHAARQVAAIEVRAREEHRHGQVLDAIAHQVSVGAAQATELARLVSVLEENRVQDREQLERIAHENRENIKLLVEPLVQALKGRK